MEKATCGFCKGSGLDPNDPGEWVPEVGMNNPYTVGPCPMCWGTREGFTTPCSEDPCDAPQLCAAHDEELAHRTGRHEYCGVTCEVELTTEMLYNFVALTGFSPEQPDRVEKLVAWVWVGNPVDQELFELIVEDGRPGTRGALTELLRRVRENKAPTCPWIPSQGIPACDFDPKCPVHGAKECPDHGAECEADDHMEPPTVGGEVI